MNYILGKFETTEELQQAENRLRELKFISTKVKGKGCPTALRLFHNGETNVFTEGDYDKYLKYKKTGMKPYAECEVTDLDNFISILQKDSKPSLNERKLAYQKFLEDSQKAVEKAGIFKEKLFPDTVGPTNFYNPKSVEETQREIAKEIKERMSGVIIEKDKLLNTYFKVSHELKAFLRLLFGDELFVEPTYKVGDKFSRKGETLVIVKINQNVVTMLDCKTFENVRTSKTVNDVNAITESELRCLLGVWRDEFNLIK